MNEIRLLNSIRDHEGYRSEPYRDHLGFWTVGYGHLIENTELRQFIKQRTIGNLLTYLIDPDHHEQWLIADVTQAIQDAEQWLGATFATLTDARQEVVVEMAFQMGASRLAGFKKFRGAIVAAAWGEAVAEMEDSKWARQTSGRASALMDKFRAG